jgi:glycyl-tRNA synthetase
LFTKSAKAWILILDMSYTVQGIVDNETLGYFIARTYLFLTGIGINKERLRFRQHLQNEMAHYAQDCWDAEIECSYGWFECVGLADRSAFDLKAHTSKSGVELVAHEVFDKPKDVEVYSHYSSFSITSC